MQFDRSYPSGPAREAAWDSSWDATLSRPAIIVGAWVLASEGGVCVGGVVVGVGCWGFRGWMDGLLG